MKTIIIKSTVMKHVCILLAAILVSSHCMAAKYATINGDTLEVDFNTPEKPTVLIVWASWCGYCMAEIPHLKEELSAHPNLNWLGLNVNKDPSDGLRVETEKSLPWRSISDPDLVIGDQFKVRGTPTLLVLNTQGHVIYKSRRVDDGFKAALASFVP